jgi:hypothetical protein
MFNDKKSHIVHNPFPKKKVLEKVFFFFEKATSSLSSSSSSSEAIDCFSFRVSWAHFFGLAFLRLCEGFGFSSNDFFISWILLPKEAF